MITTSYKSSQRSIQTQTAWIFANLLPSKKSQGRDFTVHNIASLTGLPVQKGKNNF
jgi:hypothetical protein